MRIFLFFFLLTGLKCFSQSAVTFKRNQEKFKNFLQITSKGNYAKVDNLAEFNLQGDLTIEMVIRLRQPFYPSYGAAFINSTGPNAFTEWGYGFVAGSDQRIGFHVCTIDPSPVQIMANQTDTLSVCRWYHMCGVKQGDTIRFYLDGVEKAKTYFGNRQIRTATGPAMFGFHRPTKDDWCNSNVDEFRLWNYARTPAQIASNMNDTLIGNPTGLRVYYKFDENGSGGNIAIKNHASSGQAINGLTVSANSGQPVFANTEILPFPPPPLVPTQPQVCPPGGQFDLSVNSPTGFNINRFYWYNSNHPDTSRIPNTIRKDYKTPYLSQTDTFFVSAVNSLFCESRKVGIVALVLPEIGPISLVASIDTFCERTDVTLTADSIFNPPVSYLWNRGFLGIEPYMPQPLGHILRINSLLHSDTIWVLCKSIAGGCKSNNPKIILTKLTSFPPPEVSLTDTVICSGKSTYLFVNGNQSEKVNLYSDSLMRQLDTTISAGHFYKTPDLYSDRTYWIAQGLEQRGCNPAATKISIKIKPLGKLLLPNLITLNMDGKNDFFEIKAVSDCYTVEMQIFNRWGKSIFYSGNYQSDWAGEAGTYFYRLRIGNQEYKGWLEVFK